MASALSLLCMCLVLSGIVSWNDGKLQSNGRRNKNVTPLIASSMHRSLIEEDDQNPTISQQKKDIVDITDDETRSATCKRYLYNFLNGTTDINDECEAFKNAFNAADCKDDANVGLWSSNIDRKRNESANDDLYIDDFFENWEVRILTTMIW